MWPVKFKPVPMPRIWGGHALKSTFGVQMDEPIGEYWVLSGHPNGMSVVADGPLAGRTLAELTEEHPGAYLGRSPQGRFPLLIKYLEAESDLSVQIHPDDAYAREHEGDFGKTEAWYVLDAKSDGKVNYGHTFPDRETYLRAVAEGHVRDYLNYLPIQKGDLVFVPARTLHALLAGTKVLEIQQTSDVTYRVYDWDRVDASGKPRELHVDKAADVLVYGAPVEPMDQPRILHEEVDFVLTRLAECPYFTIDRVLLRGRCAEVTHGVPGNPDVVIAVEGKGELRFDPGDGTKRAISLVPGDTALIPSDLQGYTLACTGDFLAIRTFYGSPGRP
ncbi:mannose-6-phosphate isomerase, class I [Alicyclobacillus hesperidum]|uniref:Mannose-6-phosphate isomerase n=1 Tax=Alicyclobacillus hesperidum TaxID=89784 RepID=A0A1H2Q5D0_9BACL|nr:type I phosphomannose isomerase catalytic subunit [Alicyclobacillus hesperidum]GLV12799.1 mannose-6-phosphate isomerase, class I [Alicyclobacillus hesperidum]SDW02331.1 mannose-6-phosphate isomerase, type 1 [Alicyclobacillus hesperidum]